MAIFVVNLFEKTTQNQITCFNRFDDLLGMSDGDEWE